MIGANGSGKSSLLRIMAGLDDGFTGEARLSPGFTVGLLEQEPHLDESKDVKGNVMDGVAEVAGLLERYDAVLAMYADPDADYEKIGAEQAELEAKIQAAGADDLDRQIEIAMDALRLPPGDAEVTTLSGGERRRVALCRLLLSQPDLLLLDEPTNHLDAESVAWLERTLRDYQGTVVAITHDRYFLDNVARWILELERGKGHPFEGNYSSWLEQKQARLASEEKADSTRQRTLERELEWVRMAPKARQAKGKARLAAYDKLRAEAEEAERGAEQLADPAARRAAPRRRRDRGRRRLQGLRRRLLIEDLTFKLPPAGIVGVIGPNGAGKTTLFRMITGQEQARRRHDPHRRHRRPGLRRPEPRRPRRRQDRLRGDHRRRRVHEDRQPRGERAGLRLQLQLQGLRPAEEGRACSRVASATACSWPRSSKESGNVLLLDEPTNDLDVDTLRALEDALEAFAGCAVVISHDRWFLDRIATHILAFEGDSQVRWFEGNFTEYEDWRHKELGVEADQPHRIKYKPLAR